MKPSELFSVGSHVSRYFEHDPEAAYRGIVTAIDDRSWTLLVCGKNGKARSLSAAHLVEVIDPKSESPSAGLPTDPEVWDNHHRLKFLEREHDSLKLREDDARGRLANLLQVPAMWKVIIPEIERRLAAKKK